MASEIGVQTIQHTNGTDAMTIDSSGRVLLRRVQPSLLVFLAVVIFHLLTTLLFRSITTLQMIVMTLVQILIPPLQGSLLRWHLHTCA